jgi:hypothetical protein
MIRVNHAVGYTTLRTMIAVHEDLAALENPARGKAWTGRRSP